MAKRKLTNGYSNTQIESFLKKIDKADEALGTLKSEYMESCKGPRGDIAMVFEAAKDAGIPERAFKVLVKNRRLSRRIEGNVARLEADDAENYDALVASLGDFVSFPLGAAAVSRAAEQLDPKMRH